MKKLFRSFIFFFFCVALITSCTKTDEVVPQPSIKKAPIANAGWDMLFTIPTNDVELKGSGKDADGYIVSYQWTKLSGPASMLIANPASAVTKVNLPEFGQYVLELKVKDSDGLIGIDIVNLWVDSSGIDPCLGCWDY